MTAWSKLRVTDLRVLPLDVRDNWQLSSDGKGLGYVYCRFIRLTLVAYHFYLIFYWKGFMTLLPQKNGPRVKFITSDVLYCDYMNIPDIYNKK